jgi:hypothetical protein
MTGNNRNEAATSFGVSMRRYFEAAPRLSVNRVGRLLRRVAIRVVQPILVMQRAWRRRRLADYARSEVAVTLFLAPEAGLRPYFASHALLARTLMDAGHAAIVLSCDGLLPICSNKFAMRVGHTASGDIDNAACRRCRATALEAGHDYGLVDVTVESLLDPHMRSAIADVMAAHAGEIWTTRHDDIEFGTLAAAEVLRNRRKLAIDEFTAEDVALVKALVHASLAIHFAVKALARTYRIARIVYFGDYAYWIAAQIFALREKLPILNLSHGYRRDIDRGLLMIRVGNDEAYRLRQMDEWPRFRDIPLAPKAVAEIADEALFRLGGHGGITTFSPNWRKDNETLLEELGLRSDRQTIVAYTSSNDEYVCIREYLQAIGSPYPPQRQPFATQDLWLQELVRWVASRADLQLVVRLHPRIGVGWRHSTRASEYARLQEMLADVPDNVSVIWPESPVSSYDLAEHADVALIAWTSLGLELGRFGVPVVAAFRRIQSFPTGTFISFEETAERYFAAVEAAIHKPASFASILDAFRWSFFTHLAPMIDVSDVVPDPSYADVPPHRRPRNRDMLLRAVVEGRDPVELNMESLSRGAVAGRAEREAMIASIERFVAFFVSGGTAMNVSAFGTGLRSDRRPLANAPDTANEIRIETDGALTLLINGRAFRRKSPLVRRLAKSVLLADAP